MVHAAVKCLIWTVMEILCTYALQKGRVEVMERSKNLCSDLFSGY